MTLLEELTAAATTAQEEYILDFAERMEAQIKGAASRGFYTYRYDMHKDSDNLHLMTDPNFTEMLEILLDGVKVTYKKEVKEYLLFKGRTYTDHSLIFSWAKK